MATDLELEKNDIEDDEDDDNEISLENFNVKTWVDSFSLDMIVKYIDKGIITVPKIQRDYIWSINDASMLIESLLLGLPVPPIYLFQHEKNKFKVIDGQQRIFSLYYFIKGKFPKSDDNSRQTVGGAWRNGSSFEEILQKHSECFQRFSLSTRAFLGNKVKYAGKSYEDVKDELDFATFRLCFIENKQKNPNDDTVMIEIFHRFNKRSTQLTYADLRKALYYSELYDILMECNNNAIWKKVKFLKKTNKEDLILRCFALYDFLFNKPEEKFSSLQGALAEYAKGFMKETRNSETLQNVKDNFNSFMAYIENIKDNWSVGLFDSVFISWLAYNENKNMKITKEQIDAVNTDDTFKNANSVSTNTTENIKNRVKVASQVLFGKKPSF